MAYYTRSLPRPAGYYRSLNDRSTAEVYEGAIGHRMSNRPDDTDVFEVERLVSSRRAKVRTSIVTQLQIAIAFSL